MTHAIVDSHHHIWRLEHTPWLSGPSVPRIFGAYEALRRDYTIAEFLADAIPSGVEKSVYVQVNVAPQHEVEEVAWVQSVADANRFPQAITAFADLSAPAVGDMLDREAAAGNIKAIRQQLHWHEKAQYRFASRADVLNDDRWRQGLREVERRGLAFELQVFPRQLADAVQLVRDFPATTFILLHAGMLEDRSDAGWALWTRGMDQIAREPNIVVKLSGLGTFERACSVALWQPIVVQTVDLFGPSRCMFGSNFPIEKLWTSYDHLVDVMRSCLAGYSAEERQAIFHDTAARIYRL